MADIDTTGALGRGLQLGASLGAGIRQRKLNTQYGAAINDPTQGYAGAAKIANAAGEVDDGTKFVDQGQAQAKQKLQVLGNLATSLSTVPYEQRKARIAQWAPMVQSQLGFTPEQIASVDPTDEWIANERSMIGQFSKYSEIKSVDKIGLIGMKPDGSYDILQKEPPKADVSPNGVAYTLDAQGKPTVTGQVPGYAVPKAEGSSAKWRTMTPDETSAAGLAAGTVAQINDENGAIKTIRAQRQYSETASQAADYANRTVEADKLLTNLERQHVDPNAIYALGMGDANAGSYRQAQRQFINSVLRRESGAAIAGSEFDSARQQYFPVPGDNAAQIAQKQRSRQAAIQGLIAQSQGAYGDMFGTPVTPLHTATSGAPAPLYAPSDKPKVQTKAEYDALPAGTHYIDSQGTEGIKP